MMFLSPGRSLLVLALGLSLGCVSDQVSTGKSPAPAEEGRTATEGSNDRGHLGAEEGDDIPWESISVRPHAVELPGGRPGPLRLPTGTDPRETSIVKWVRVPTQIHFPLLQAGVTTQTWYSDSTIPPRVKQTLRSEGRSYLIMSPRGLRPFLREIRCKDEALSYFMLLRAVLSPENVASQRLGKPLVPHKNPLTERGEYGPDETARWGLPFSPRIIEVAGAFHIERPVLLYAREPARDDTRAGCKGWRVDLMEERVTRKGEHSFRILRFLDPEGFKYLIERF